MKAVFLANEREVWAWQGGEPDVLEVVGEADAGLGAPLDVVQAVTLEPVAMYAGVTESPVPGAKRVGVRALFDWVSAEQYAVVAEAVPIVEWRRAARFCGVCGAGLVRDNVERCMVCEACGYRVYPRLNPAVITCITRGGGEEVLLARRAGNTGFFSVIAGFVEAGESLEHAVAREVREEVGIEVGNLRYFGSQGWPFPNSLMIGFLSEWVGGEIRVDGVEIGEAGWFRRDCLPELPGRISIARRMVDAWSESLLK